MPAALEAIVLKAMALRPADRYGSAQALAEEVERWLADEPVPARREPFWERARRWMRRRRTLVAAIAATLLAATVGLAAVLLVQTRANASLKSANLELALANQRTSVANRDLRLANDTRAGPLRPGTGGDQDVPRRGQRGPAAEGEAVRRPADQAAPRRDRLLSAAGGPAQGQADRHSRAALGQAYHDIGELTAKIGSQAEALAALKRGLELRLALAAEASVGRRDQAGMPAQSLIAVGDLQEATGELDRALASYEQARDLLEPLARSEPDEPRTARPWRSASTASPGSSTTPAMRRSRSRRTSRRGPSARAWPTPIPTSPSSRATWRLSYHDIGAIHRASGRIGPRHWRRTSKPGPSARSWPRPTPRPRNSRATWPRATTTSASCSKRPDISPRRWRRSSRRGRSCRSWPTPTPPSLSSRATWRRATRSSARSRTRPGHPAEALASFERARAILQKLAAANPTLTLFQNRLAMSHSYVGQARRRGGRPAEAAAEFRQAVAIMERLSQPPARRL